MNLLFLLQKAFPDFPAVRRRNRIRHDLCSLCQHSLIRRNLDASLFILRKECRRIIPGPFQPDIIYMAPVIRVRKGNGAGFVQAKLPLISAVLTGSLGKPASSKGLDRSLRLLPVRHCPKIQLLSLAISANPQPIGSRLEAGHL